jgi:hypothetical protein
MTASDHSLLSSYREMLLEHLFAGAVMRHVWLSGVRRLEVLKPQVDDGGYDLVLEGNAIVRHVQLKATMRNAHVGRFKVNTGLALKPSGCVVVLIFDPDTLELGPFLWFGNAPGKALPSLQKFSVATHTKPNSAGVKSPRPKIRSVPRSAFQKVPDIPGIAQRLFGTLPTTANPPKKTMQL